MRYDLKPGDLCPECGNGSLFDPDYSNISLPPTGGDFEYVLSTVSLQCENCKIEINSSYKSCFDLETKTVRYIKQ